MKARDVAEALDLPPEELADLFAHEAARVFRCYAEIITLDGSLEAIQQGGKWTGRASRYLELAVAFDEEAERCRAEAETS